MNLTWKPNRGQFATGQSLYLKDIRVASYSWDSLMPAAERKTRGDWIGFMDLPSLKGYRPYAHTEEEMQSLIEKQIKGWFIRAGF